MSALTICFGCDACQVGATAARPRPRWMVGDLEVEQLAAANVSGKLQPQRMALNLAGPPSQGISARSPLEPPINSAASALRPAPYAGRWASPRNRGQHHITKPGLLLGRQSAKGLWRLEEAVDQLRPHLPALGRGDQDVDAAVRRISLADDEASLFEAVGRVYDRGRTAMEAGRQLLLGDRMVGVELDQGPSRYRRQANGRRRLIYTFLPAAKGLDYQCPQLVGARWVPEARDEGLTHEGQCTFAP